MAQPKLRFKREDGTEFPKWEETSFGDTCSGFEYGMNTAACSYDGIHKYIRITDIDDTSRRYLSENAVSPNGNMQDKYIVNVNDILFARTGASVGKAYLYKESDGLLYYAGFLIRVNVNDDNNAYFIFSQSLTSDYNNWVKLTSMRTGQQGINAQEYKSYKFYAPCLEEQQKIADFLSNVDEAIAQSEAEVQNLEQQKKAAMQKIFSQEVRFRREYGTEYPEWEELTMDDIFTEIIEKNRTDLPVLSILQGQGTVYRDSSDRNIMYDRKNTVNYKAMKKGDFIIHLRTFEGGLECATLDGISSPAYKILRTNRLIPEAYKGYFRSRQFIDGRLAIAVTGVRDGKSIEMSTFWQIIVPVPCLEEQQKIADFLSAYDDVITYAKQELDKWKELKKGLLQQMFV